MSIPRPNFSPRFLFIDGVISSRNYSVFVNGKLPTVVGDLVANTIPPTLIETGSPRVLIHGSPAAAGTRSEDVRFGW
jgi:uncharacterized Zn-binding protein involved in type VI secretion